MRAWGTLALVDTESCIYVAPENAPGEWVARFDKAPGFPALEWAERMVALHNSELRTRPAGKHGPPVSLAEAPFNPA